MDEKIRIDKKFVVYGIRMETQKKNHISVPFSLLSLSFPPFIFEFLILPPIYKSVNSVAPSNEFCQCSAVLLLMPLIAIVAPVTLVAHNRRLIFDQIIRSIQSSFGVLLVHPYAHEVNGVLPLMLFIYSFKSFYGILNKIKNNFICFLINVITDIKNYLKSTNKCKKLLFQKIYNRFA